MGFVGIQTGFGSTGRRSSLRKTWMPSDRQGLQWYTFFFVDIVVLFFKNLNCSNLVVIYFQMKLIAFHFDFRRERLNLIINYNYVIFQLQILE